VDVTVLAGHQCAITLNHRGHLLALIGMHDKYDFVMSHLISLWFVAPRHAKDGGARLEQLKINNTLFRMKAK
jgi:hypothetical protein